MLLYGWGVYFVPSTVPSRSAAAHPLALPGGARTVSGMYLPRPVRFLAGILVLAACSAGATSAPTLTSGTQPPPPTSSLPSTASAPSTVDVPAPDLTRWSGLLALDGDSGDLLRFDGGTWIPVQDGPRYDDQEAMTFVESAVSTSDGVLAGWCCEPVIGFVAPTGDRYPSPLFYGTRPAWLSDPDAVVTFQDLFTDDGSLATSLLISMSDGDGYRSSEHPLPQVRQHGRRLLAVSPDTLAFTWSPDPPAPDMSPAGTWFLGFATLSAAGLDLRLETGTPISGALDLAASRSGDVYLYSTGVRAAWFTFSPAEGVRRGGALPSSVFDLAVLDGTLLVLTDGGLLLGPEFTVFPASVPSPVWVGW